MIHNEEFQQLFGEDGKPYHYIYKKTDGSTIPMEIFVKIGSTHTKSSQELEQDMNIDDKQSNDTENKSTKKDIDQQLNSHIQTIINTPTSHAIMGSQTLKGVTPVDPFIGQALPVGDGSGVPQCNHRSDDNISDNMENLISERPTKYKKDNLFSCNSFLVNLIFYIALFFTLYLLYTGLSHCRGNYDAVFSNKPYCISGSKNANTRDPYNDHLIGHAARLCHVNVFKALQTLGANPGSYDNYALRHASKNGCVEIVKLLLEDPNVDPNAESGSSLIHAAANGHYEIVKMLFENDRTTEGYAIAIVVSVMSKHITITNYLLASIIEKYNNGENFDNFYHYALHSNTNADGKIIYKCPWN
jgi:hypothetical protein